MHHVCIYKRNSHLCDSLWKIDVQGDSFIDFFTQT